MRDDGTVGAGTARSSNVGGHGLIGMRERVGLHGGHLRAGLAPQGGFAVHATFPLNGAAPMTISVVLADDQALVRAGFRLILEAEDDLEVVGEAATAKRRSYTVTLAARRRLDGHADAETRRPRGNPTDRADASIRSRVLILTTFEQDDYVFEALRAGASGFLLKNAPPEDLVQAVRIVAAGDALLAPSVTRRVIEEYSQRSAPIKNNAALELLTERELEVLKLLATGKSNAELATQLYLGEGTIKTHVSHLLAQARPARPGTGGRLRLRERPHLSWPKLTAPGQARRSAPQSRHLQLRQNLPMSVEVTEAEPQRHTTGGSGMVNVDGVNAQEFHHRSARQSPSPTRRPCCCLAGLRGRQGRRFGRGG